MPAGPESIFSKPYWRLSEIIELATYRKFGDDSFGNESDKVFEFKAELLSEIKEVILAKKIISLDRNVDNDRNKKLEWIDKNEIYLNKTVSTLGVLFVLAMAYLIHKNFNSSPELHDFISKFGYHPTYIILFIAAILTVVYYVFTSAIWLTHLIYMAVKYVKRRTPRDNFNYQLLDAKFRGFHLNFYESERIIDFLNEQYSFKIEKSMFRDWIEPFFRRNGEYWIVGYQGKKICLEDSVIMEKIACLLSNPNKDFSANEFTKVAPDLGANNTSEYDNDREYQNYKNEMIRKGLDKGKTEELIKMLKTQIEDADGSVSAETLLEYKNQIDHLERYVNEGFTFNGNEKPPRDNNIRAQESMEQAIKRFINKLKKVHPLLAEHLKCIRKSSTFCYRPPDDIKWDVQF